MEENNNYLPEQTSDTDRVIQVNIEEQMKTAYIDYSMSVIVGRALPDARDGFKPVHRRVLYAMHELGNSSNRPYKKSARVVGEVMGKYHPHGDSSIYDTLVRMAQEWTMRHRLVDGQGNFGNQDGDPPAAMRYTECRLQRFAEAMLEDIEKDTVDFQFNFDDSLKEPVVLPTRIPQLLVNGSSGIAVGMATNMMPHNLSEVIDGCVAYIDDHEITAEGLMKYIKAPDFPTGGVIFGIEGIRQGMLTGRGRVVLRGKCNVEILKSGREQIVINAVPYQVGLDQLTDKIGQLVSARTIEGISNVNNESNMREGVRIVVELKRDVVPQVIINQLYKYTELQTSYGINNVALSGGRPKIMNIRDLVVEFVDFRMEVVIRRSKFELKKAEQRAHILEGLLKTIQDRDHLDKAIATIRDSKTPDEAKSRLLKLSADEAWTLPASLFDEGFAEHYTILPGLSEDQVKAILELRLQRLTGLEREKIVEEFNELMATIARLKELLGNTDKRYELIKDELQEVKDKFGEPRRSEIQYAANEMRMEDLIEKEDVVITISHLGYVKRTSATEYRQQRRGGRGAIGSRTRNEDYVEHLFVASTHDYMLFFTEKGRCYWLKVYEIPEGEKQGKGRAIQNLIQIPSDDKVRAILSVGELEKLTKRGAVTEEETIDADAEVLDDVSAGDEVISEETDESADVSDIIPVTDPTKRYIVLCTKKGIVKKTDLKMFSRPRANGINAINIVDGDELLEARLVTPGQEIMLAISSGRAIRFNEAKVRPTGRGATGVSGMDFDEANDELVGMITVNSADAEKTVLVISEKGYGKRTDIDEYRITNRGGKGVRTINVTEKTGGLVAILDVAENQDLIITCKSGVTLRTSVKSIKNAGRATQGVKVINIGNNDAIAAISKIAEQEEEETELPEGATTTENGEVSATEAGEMPLTEGEVNLPGESASENAPDIEPDDLPGN